MKDEHLFVLFHLNGRICPRKKIWLFYDQIANSCKWMPLQPESKGIHVYIIFAYILFEIRWFQ